MFRLALILCLFGLSKSVPSFEWITNRSPSTGIPFLAINYSKIDQDFAILHPYNPIPLMENESPEDIDNCTFRGRLMNDADGVVTLTGGCPYENSFEIMITSKKLRSSTFIVKNGVVKEIVPFGKYNLVDNMNNFQSLSYPTEKQLKDVPSFPDTGFTVRLAIRFDQRFKTRFGTDSNNAIRRVMAFVQHIYEIPGLPTAFNMEIAFVASVPVSVSGAPTINAVNTLQKYNSNSTINSNVYFTFNNNQIGVPGGIAAGIGTVCDPIIQNRMSVNAWTSTDAMTAYYVAHEVGHNLGMSHDFNQQQGNPRYDSKGKSCTRLGSVMGYDSNPFTLVWSTCSSEDFISYYQRSQPFCLSPGPHVEKSEELCIQNGGDFGCFEYCAGWSYSPKHGCVFKTKDSRFQCNCSFFADQGQ